MGLGELLRYQAVPTATAPRAISVVRSDRNPTSESDIFNTSSEAAQICCRLDQRDWSMWLQFNLGCGCGWTCARCAKVLREGESPRNSQQGAPEATYFPFGTITLLDQPSSLVGIR